VNCKAQSKITAEARVVRNNRRAPKGRNRNSPGRKAGTGFELLGTLQRVQHSQSWESVEVFVRSAQDQAVFYRKRCQMGVHYQGTDYLSLGQHVSQNVPMALTRIEDTDFVG
jgi:hypothetical protein